MRNFRILPLILLVALLLSCFAPAAWALEDPEVASNAVLIMETDSRSILYSKNENARVYPASTTKIMTVLLALEAVESGRISLTDQVTAGESMNYDLIPDGSSAGIQVGETMTLQDLLYCAMLASGNDACNVIAAYVGGDLATFIEMMNRRATELGCVGTRFANAHGLPNDNHYTTVWDFAQIALEAIGHSEFMTICDTASYIVPPTNLSEQRTLQNSNGLINEASPTYPGYKYEYAHGIKTGYTSAAGYCLLSTAVKEDVRLLCVVMGGVYTESGGKGSYSNFTDSRALYEWGFENFSFRDILTTKDMVGRVPVIMGADAESVALRPQNTLTAFLPNATEMDAFRLDVKITAEEDEDGTLRAPIAAGAVLGEVTVSLGSVSYGTVNLVAASAVDLSKLSYLKNAAEEVLSLFWVRAAIAAAAVLLVMYLLVVILYRRRRRQYIRAMRAKQAEQKRRRAAQSVPTAPEKSAVPPEKETVSASSAPQTPATSPGRRAVDDDYFNEFFKR